MKRGKTRSAVMREALRKYFFGEKKQNEVSCIDLPRGLEGAIDLSTNPTYMNGYGR